MTYDTRVLAAEAEDETREEQPPDEDMSCCLGCDWPISLCTGATEACGGRWGEDGAWVG